VWCDGASRGNPGPASYGVVICDPSGAVCREIGEAIGRDTNQAAEYEALLRAIKELIDLGARRATIYTDSQFVVRQFTGEYKARDPRMKTYVDEARRRASALEKLDLIHILRSSHPNNVKADGLANRALDEQKKK
jgi:ribonuclease HI